MKSQEALFILIDSKSLFAGDEWSAAFEMLYGAKLGSHLSQALAAERAGGWLLEAGTEVHAVVKVFASLSMLSVSCKHRVERYLAGPTGFPQLFAAYVGEFDRLSQKSREFWRNEAEAGRFP